LGTRIGRLVAAEFADPHRLATLGVTRFVRFAANRGLRVRRSAADRVVAAARTALPAPEAVVARQVLADDLGLLAELDVQIAAAEAQIAKLLPDTPFAVLLTVPGWGRRYQPGRQCGFAAGADRPRDRVMAQRSGRPLLWPTAAGPRQEGWGDRLCDGQLRQQDRLRAGP
jgi:transposase